MCGRGQCAHEGPGVPHARVARHGRAKRQHVSCAEALSEHRDRHAAPQRSCRRHHLEEHSLCRLLLISLAAPWPRKRDQWCARRVLLFIFWVDSTCQFVLKNVKVVNVAAGAAASTQRQWR